MKSLTNPFNILLTCAGRRVDVVRAFANAIGERGRLFACDSTGEAPALQLASCACVVPSVDDPGYIDALLDVCRTHGIGAVLPALEPELPLLARARDRFLEIGTFPLVSSLAVVETCFDKVATNQFLNECGLSGPITFLSVEDARDAVLNGEIAYPLILKPRWGVSSIDTEIAHDEEELRLLYRLIQKRLGHGFLRTIHATAPDACILIQPLLNGTEYGLDVVNDLEGRHVATLVKRKLRMRAGQTDRAVTVSSAALQQTGRELGRKLGHIGILDCDAFVTSEGIKILDLNPRLGGGYVFSHRAGANVPAALLAWLAGEEPDPRWLEAQTNILSARCDCIEILNNVHETR